MAVLSLRLLVAACAVSVISACGEAPLQSLGERSSEWLNEPEVTTTTIPPVTVPSYVDSIGLQWSNDDIITENLSDTNALISEVFARREGDRFIQASRAEIASALPSVQFPARVPFGAEWVSSQLVIENTGLLSDDPTAAFGIWSAEPYSRSRSVAQMAVLTVSISEATELEDEDGEPTCARFADPTTDQCRLIDSVARPVWELSSTAGTTLIWFDSAYRYELFGRSYLSTATLMEMASASVALSELGSTSS